MSGLASGPGGRAARLWRTGARLAATGGAALGTAARLRALRGVSDANRRRERARVFRDVSRRVLELHGVEVVVEGELPEGAALLAANHVSWLDPLVVGSALPCVPISKVDVSAWPVVGGFARDLGVLFVSRGDPRSGMRVLRGAREALALGLPVLNFPEGTTSDGSTVLGFRRGLFGMAARLGVPVVPVAVAYQPERLAWVGNATFLPHYLRLAGDAGARVVLRLGTPLAPSLGAGALAQAARASILDLLGGLRATAVGP